MNTDIVQCGDLKFQKLYSKEKILEQVVRMASEIDAHFQDILKKDPDAKIVIVGILNGAFMFASELVQQLKTPVFLEFIKVKSYKGEVSGELQIVSSINEQLINDSYLLVVDDICDSGNTLNKIKDKLHSDYKIKDIKFATLIIRPDKKQVKRPEFVGLNCSEFIIGFGLDYNQYGRQYSSIYQKIKQ